MTGTGASSPPPLAVARDSARTGSDQHSRGEWRPASSDLEVELPGLIEELARQGMSVSRVAYHRDRWKAAPRRISVDGRWVRLAWFRGLDRDSVSLALAGRDRLDLSVPADPAQEAAEPAAGRTVV